MQSTVNASEEGSNPSNTFKFKLFVTKEKYLNLNSVNLRNRRKDKNVSMPKGSPFFIAKIQIICPSKYLREQYIIMQHFCKCIYHVPSISSSSL